MLLDEQDPTPAAADVGDGQRGQDEPHQAEHRAEDARSLPAFCNTFLEMAGIDRRVEEVHPSGGGATEDPEFGSMVRMVRRNYPTPPHDCTRTTDELGRPPTPLIEGLGLTIEWLRRHGKL